MTALLRGRVATIIRDERITTEPVEIVRFRGRDTLVVLDVHWPGEPGSEFDVLAAYDLETGDAVAMTEAEFATAWEADRV